MFNAEIIRDKFDRFVTVTLQELPSRVRYRVTRAVLAEIRKEASRLLKGKASRALERRARAILWYTTKKEPRVGFIRKIPVDKARVGPGVGISLNNIHWAVLGTKDRFTKTGRCRGKMSAFFAGVLSQALVNCQARAWERARETLRREFKNLKERRR